MYLVSPEILTEGQLKALNQMKRSGFHFVKLCEHVMFLSPFLREENPLSTHNQWMNSVDCVYLCACICVTRTGNSTAAAQMN